MLNGRVGARLLKKDWPKKNKSLISEKRGSNNSTTSLQMKKKNLFFDKVKLVCSQKN